MKTPKSLLLAALLLPLSAVAATPDSVALLTDLARAHEQIFKTLPSDHIAVVLQKGEKQFTIYGVTNVRAVGVLLEITVKTGEKYSVSPADVFFISNNGFKI